MFLVALPPAPVGPLENDHQWAAFPAALVALAGLIFIVGVGGICFICYKWSRYTAYKNQVQRIVVSPRYEPVYMEHSPSLKEYETQVIHFSNSTTKLHFISKFLTNHQIRGHEPNSTHLF